MIKLHPSLSFSYLGLSPWPCPILTYPTLFFHCSCRLNFRFFVTWLHAYFSIPLWFSVFSLICNLLPHPFIFFSSLLSGLFFPPLFPYPRCLILSFLLSFLRLDLFSYPSSFLVSRLQTESSPASASHVIFLYPRCIIIFFPRCLIWFFLLCSFRLNLYLSSPLLFRSCAFKQNRLLRLPFSSSFPFLVTLSYSFSCPFVCPFNWG